MRVSLDIAKPLKPFLLIHKGADVDVHIVVKYERLSIFCFFCGVLGHEAKECTIKSIKKQRGENVELQQEQGPYGSHLKAPNPVNVFNKWMQHSSDVHPVSDLH